MTKRWFLFVILCGLVLDAGIIGLMTRAARRPPDPATFVSADAPFIAPPNPPPLDDIVTGGSHLGSTPWPPMASPHPFTAPSCPPPNLRNWESTRLETHPHDCLCILVNGQASIVFSFTCD